MMLVLSVVVRSRSSLTPPRLRKQLRFSSSVRYPLRLLLLAFTASLLIHPASRLFADIVTIQPGSGRRGVRSHKMINEDVRHENFNG